MSLVRRRIMERKKLEALLYQSTHNDFKGEGVKTVLHLNPRTGGTEAWPLSKFTDAELIAKLPRRVRDLHNL
jgi:hypothetical protein